MSAYSQGAKTGPNYPPGTGNVDEIIEDTIKRARAYMTTDQIELLRQKLNEVWIEKDRENVNKEVNTRMKQE